MTEHIEGFNPDWVSVPGDTIADVLEERGWTQVELALRMGYTPKHVNQLIKGKVPITEDAALRLENVIGSTAGFWLRREAIYRERLARLERAASIPSEWENWVNGLPVQALMKLGCLPKIRQGKRNTSVLIEQCAKFFGVASPKEWEERYGTLAANFRRTRTNQQNNGAITAWLRIGEQVMEKLATQAFGREQVLDRVADIRRLTCLPPEQFQPRLTDLLSACGIAFVLVPALPGSGVSGVARWLTPARPMIQMSLYGKWNDRFWFTLFHELAHLVLHSAEKKAVFLDDPGNVNGAVDSDQEREADAWAANQLIAPEAAVELRNLRTADMVNAFSAHIGIHPGIVVGRMQHDRLIAQSWLNRLKVRFQLVEHRA